MQTQRETVRKKSRSRTVQLNQKKPEVRSEVCNLYSVVTETFGVLSLFGVTQCYSYNKIKSVIINCNSTWQIPNKSSVKSRTHKLFVTLPSKHATVHKKQCVKMINVLLKDFSFFTSRGAVKGCIFVHMCHKSTAISRSYFSIGWEEGNIACLCSMLLLTWSICKKQFRSVNWNWIQTLESKMISNYEEL
jgi:hypothetical protein